MSVIIDLKTRKVIKAKIPKTKKEEKQKTISFLKELIGNLEKDNLDPEGCIVLVSYKTEINKSTDTESFDLFNSDMHNKEILGLMALVKHKLLNEIII